MADTLVFVCDVLSGSHSDAAAEAAAAAE